MKKNLTLQKFLIPIIILIFAACGSSSKEQAPGPAEKSQGLQPQSYQPYVLRKKDPVNDPADCSNGKSVDGDLMKDADLQEGVLTYNAETGEFILKTKLAELIANSSREYGSDPDSYPFTTGGHVFWVKGTPRNEDSEWLVDRIGNNSFNYMIFEDEKIEFFRYHFENTESGWEEVLNTNFIGTIENGLISMTVPQIEVIPAGTNPENLEIYWMVTTFDGFYCDMFGIDENGNPNQVLELDLMPEF